MAAGTDFSPLFTDVEPGYSKDNGGVSVGNEISENVNDFKQTLNGRPPRHLSIVRHSICTPALVSPTEMVVNT